MNSAPLRSSVLTLTLPGPQCLHCHTPGGRLRPSLLTTRSISLVKKARTTDCCTQFCLGNYRDYSDHVYEWDAEEEEWNLDGKILEGRSQIGLSLVPLSSGIMDYCANIPVLCPSRTLGPSREIFSNVSLTSKGMLYLITGHELFPFFSLSFQ